MQKSINSENCTFELGKLVSVSGEEEGEETLGFHTLKQQQAQNDER